MYNGPEITIGLSLCYFYTNGTYRRRYQHLEVRGMGVWLIKVFLYSRSLRMSAFKHNLRGNALKKTLQFPKLFISCNPYFC